jgi:hypothetical protein
MRFPDVEKNLAENALRDDRVKRLVTIGDVNAIVALGVLAAIGDVARFSSPQNCRTLGLRLAGLALRYQLPQWEKGGWPLER